MAKLAFTTKHLFFTPSFKPLTRFTTTTTTMSATKPHPSLELSGGGLDSFLPAFTTLNQPYQAYPIVGSNTHVETIFAFYFRSTPDVRLRRECLRTKDNGTVSLDWVVGGHNNLSPKSPTLILLFYSASFLGDIREVVDHVSNRYPEANLYAAGWSLGGNIIFNYLAQEAENCRLSGAVSLCNPFNLVFANEDIRKGFSIVYDKALASSLRRIFKKHAPLFEEMSDEFNIPAAANCRSIREFDEALTSVSFGFKSVDDYYSKSSSSKSIQHVRTLCYASRLKMILLLLLERFPEKLSMRTQIVC